MQDLDGGLLRQVGSAKDITTVAAGLGQPDDVLVDLSGTVYLTDRGSSTVKRVAQDGTVSIVAGLGVASARA